MAEVILPAPYTRLVSDQQCAGIGVPTDCGIRSSVTQKVMLFQSCLGSSTAQLLSVGPVGARRSVGISAKERYQVDTVGWDLLT